MGVWKENARDHNIKRDQQEKGGKGKKNLKKKKNKPKGRFHTKKRAKKLGRFYPGTVRGGKSTKLGCGKSSRGEKKKRGEQKLGVIGLVIKGGAVADRTKKGGGAYAGQTKKTRAAQKNGQNTQGT